jgi:hypothetical protein
MRHQRKFLSVIAIVAFSVNSWTVLGQKQNKMTHSSSVTAHTSAWEYKVTGLIALDEMNKLGAEGWELIAVQAPNIDNIGLYFKRRKRWWRFRIVDAVIAIGFISVSPWAFAMLKNWCPVVVFRSLNTVLNHMRSRIPVLVMILLTAFVIQTVARIEVLNTRAGNYLPRNDLNPDATLADGKWRVSEGITPRNQLRSVVQTFGLLQYVLAPLLFMLAVAVSLKSRKSWMKVAGSVSVFVSVIAVWLMLYREYYQSLGWWNLAASNNYLNRSGVAGRPPTRWVFPSWPPPGQLISLGGQLILAWK